MTGPAEGKIPIEIDFFFEGRKIPCDTYIHVKGYSRARVTHLDLEGFKASAGKERVPGVIVGGEGEVTIILMENINIAGLRGRKLKIRGLSILHRGERSGVYVGIKDGGIYVGFKREIIRRLEGIAKRLQPELFRGKDSSLDVFLSGGKDEQ